MPSMDAANVKKLQDYAVYLANQADKEEREGKSSDATKNYLKLIDVLLLLGRESNDHPTWLRYSKSAEFYQNKVRGIVSRRDQQQQTRIDSKSSDESQRPGALRRIFGVRQKPQGEEEATAVKENRTKENQVAVLSNNTPLPETGREPKSMDVQEASNAPTSTTDKTKDEAVGGKNHEEEATVPHSQYEQALLENDTLKQRLDLALEKLRHAENENKELAERLGRMVSKAEYDELKAELARSVPMSQYAELQRLSVPRELYFDAEKRALKLEARLEESIPKSILDDLANELSFLLATAEIPKTDERNEKEEKSPS